MARFLLKYNLKRVVAVHKLRALEFEADALFKFKPIGPRRRIRLRFQLKKKKKTTWYLHLSLRPKM